MKQQFSQAIEYIGGFLALFLLDLVPALLAIGFLILADTCTGVWAAVKKGEKITSRRLGGIVPKLILYPLAIIIAKVAKVYLAPDIPWVYVTLGILATVEVRSNFENIGDILGFNLWTRIKKALWKDKLDPEILDDGRKTKEGK